MTPHDQPPDLRAVTAAFLQAGARFVVIGGFAVIANRFVRATRDIDLLIPADDGNDAACAAALVSLDGVRTWDGRAVDDAMLSGAPHVRADTRGGLIDLIREGAPPLDYATVADDAFGADLGDGLFLVAGLRSIVAFKRLADRPQDRLDLMQLEAEHGELPVDPIPGLDIDG